MKEEDRETFANLANVNGFPIHIWHVFFDLAYGIAFDEAPKVASRWLHSSTVQVFQAPGGAQRRSRSTSSIITTDTRWAKLPKNRIESQVCRRQKCHILPMSIFEGGKMSLTGEALKVLRETANAKD